MRRISLLVIVCLAACGGDTVTKDAAVAVDAASAVDAAGACSWPAQYDPSDAGFTGACRAGRYFWDCEFDGYGQLCVTSSASGCADDVSSCEDQCAGDEYGIECGSGPNVSSDLPAGCRSLGAVPSGAAFGCCPCGS